MVESVVVTLLPILFLIVLFGGGEWFRRQNVNMDGDPPIDKKRFYVSKYSIVVLWAATAAQSWGLDLSFLPIPTPFRAAALCLWIGGFLLLFAGRFGLGDSFRIGSPMESTRLKTNGLFGLSRNPMYVGVHATLLAAIIYTVNPILLLVGIFVIAVHHKIVLAEELYLRNVFGEEYAAYSRRVRRYL